MNISPHDGLKVFCVLTSHNISQHLSYPYLLKERDIAIGYAPFLIYNGQTLHHYYFWRKIPIPYMSLLLRQ